MSSSSTASTPPCRCSARWCASRTSSTAIIISTGCKVFSRAPCWKNKATGVTRRVGQAKRDPPLAGFAHAQAALQFDSMANRQGSQVEITPEVLLKAYACGIFPMAESAEDPALYWIEPERRGILPLDRLHVPSRLARTVRSDRFAVMSNRDFAAVIDGCAEPKAGRSRTLIHARTQ